MHINNDLSNEKSCEDQNIYTRLILKTMEFFTRFNIKGDSGISDPIWSSHSFLLLNPFSIYITSTFVNPCYFYRWNINIIRIGCPKFSIRVLPSEKGWELLIYIIDLMHYQTICIWYAFLFSGSYTITYKCQSTFSLLT